MSEKEKEAEYCEGCGFPPNLPELGVFIKRKDGKYFHQKCGARAVALGE